MKKYIVSSEGKDIEICTIPEGYTIKDLRSALKSGYKARLAKPGEGNGLTQKHYSSSALIFG